MFKLDAHADNNSIYIPGSPVESGSEAYHLYFIAGNPGTIGHYHEFLADLQRKVEHPNHDLASKASISLTVYGASLPNFTDDNIRHGQHGVLSLQETVTCAREHFVRYVNAQHNVSRDAPPKVILCAHSLGAYIGLEIIEWWQKQDIPNKVTGRPSVVGLVGLFPSIEWFEKSPKGQGMSPYFNSPLMPAVVFVVEKFLGVMPRWLLLKFIMWESKQRRSIVEVTVDLFKSRRGIRQMAYLIRDTINQVKEDRWTPDVFGQPTPETPDPARIIFHFGYRDPAVNDEVRDQLIALRGRSADQTGPDESWKPVMEVDTNGLPHMFFDTAEHNDATSTVAARHVLSLINA